MSITDELRKWAKGSTLSSWTAEHLTAIADRIDAEHEAMLVDARKTVYEGYIELPKDADGVPIHVGDTVYGCVSGRKSQATGLRLEDAWVILTNHGFGEPHIFTHSSPDSWERIADELDEWCNSVGVDGDACDKPRDLAERIRKLAKEGEHE